MNYIKQLQADKAETLDSARSIEAAINHLISYLSCLKFHVNTRVQVGDVLRDLLPIQGMNDFESERAAKAARFRQLAEKHANIATGRHFAARERLEMIPLGQPILVGHHPEKHHRRDLKRIDEHFAKAKEHHDKAEYFRRRAAAAESNVIIFSDDPDATEKLVDKIERLKKRQGVMKRANHLIRKADREGLADLGFSEETIAKLFAQDFDGRAGFPNYALANNSANIRRLEKRLAVIQNAQHDETAEEQFPGGVRLVDNVGVNRLQIFFTEIPTGGIRGELKRNGFHWPRLPELGNGIGATAQPTSPN